MTGSTTAVYLARAALKVQNELLIMVLHRKCQKSSPSQNPIGIPVNKNMTIYLPGVTNLLNKLC